MAKKDSLEDLAILAGLGIVGVMAYNTYFPGKSAQDIMKSLDTVIKNFFAGLPKAGELNLTSFLPPLPEPALASQPQPQLPQQPQQTIIQIPAPTAATPPTPRTPAPTAELPSSTPSTNTAPIQEDFEPKVKEPPPAQKPKGSGQLPNNPTIPPPPSGSGGAIIAFAGDWDSNNRSQQTSQVITKENCQLIVGVGDYSYSDEKASTWFDKIVGQQWRGKMKGCLGNHDVHDKAGFLSVFGQSAWNTVAKVAPNLVVVFIDTESGINAAQLDTLTTQAKGMGAKHIAYVFHKPYITSANGHHKPSENKWSGAIDAAAKKHGVKLLIAGHNHLYEHFKCGEQHYVTSGAAGRKFYAGNCQACGTTKCVEDTNGFLKVSVGASLMCQFISNAGETLDSFTIA